MADREFKIRLSANIDDVINDFKQGSKELKKFAEGVSQVENKLDSLSDTGAYLKEIASLMGQLNKAIGGKDIDFNFLEGAGSSQEKAEQLLTTLKEIVQVGAQFKSGGAGSVGDVIDNIGSAATVASKSVDELKAKIDSLAKSAEKNRNLEIYSKEDVDAERGKTKEERQAYYQKQVQAYKELKEASSGALGRLNAGEALSADDYEILIKYTAAVSKLRVLSNNLNVGGLAKFIDSSGLIQTTGVLDKLQKSMNKMQKSDKTQKGTSVKVEEAKKTAEVLEDVSQATEKVNAVQDRQSVPDAVLQETQAYKELNEQIQRYLQLKGESEKLDSDSPEYDEKSEEMDNIIEDISDKYKLSDAKSEDLSDKLMMDDIDQSKAMSILQNSLGDKFPPQFEEGAKSAAEAMNEASVAADKLASGINEIPSDAGVDPAKVREGTAAIEDQSGALRERNQLEQQAPDDIDDDLKKENGALEEKLELLRDIAEQHGLNITQRDRNRYDELGEKDGTEAGLTDKETDRFYELGEKIETADQSLEEFGATYDKIILKLENGKNVEILPNDKGLRDLLKFADEGMGEAYNGIQVEDVIFQRTEEATVALNEMANAAANANASISQGQDPIPQKIDSYEELCRVVERYNQLVLKGMTEGKTLTDADKNELEAIEQRFAATKGALDDPDKYLNHAMSMDRGRGMLGDYDVDKLAQYLGFEVPAAANKAEDSMDQVATAATNLDAQIDKTQGGEPLANVEQGAKEATNAVNGLTEALEKEAKAEQANSALRPETQDVGNEDSKNYDQGYEEGMQVADTYSAQADALREELETERNRNQEERNALENEIESLKSQLNNSSQDSGMTADLSAEASSLESLRNAVNEVSTAVNEKNAAFAAESDIVSGAVQKEIADLNNLKTAVEGVTGAVKDKTAAFQAEASAVANGVKKEENVKKENKQKQPKDTFAADKDKAKRSFDSYFNSLDADFISENDVNRLATMESRLNSITNSGDLDRWLQDWKEVTAAISQATKETESLAKSSQNRVLKGLSNSLEKSFKDAKLDPLSANTEESDIYKRYSNIMSELDAYSQKGSYIVDKDKIKSLEEEAAAVKKLIDAYAQKNKAEAEALAKEKARKKQEELPEKALKNQEKVEKNKLYTLFGAADNAGISDSAAGKAAMDSARESLEKYIAAKKKLDESPDDLEQVQEVGKLKAAYDQATASLKELINETNRLGKKALWQRPVDPNESASVEATLKNAVKDQYGDNVRIKFDKLSEGARELGYSVKSADGSFSHFTATLNQAGTVVTATNSRLKDTEGIIRGFISGSLGKMKNALQVFSGYDLFFRGIEEVRRGVGYITEIDTALTELKKVTDETDETYNQFLQTMSKTGAQIGATVSNLTTMAADWARLGYNIEEAGKLAESTAILLNVSEFTSAEDASAALISTMQAFGYAAEDSMHVVDVLNEIGKLIACR